MGNHTFAALVAVSLRVGAAFAAPFPDPAMRQFVAVGDFGRDTAIATATALDRDSAVSGNAALADESPETKRREDAQTAAGVLGWGVLGIMGTAIGLATTTFFLLIVNGGPLVGGC
jgi:hypothetical protein